MVSSSVPTARDADFRAWFAGLDWTRSALGPPQDWPQPLSTLVELALDTRTPVFIAWGADLRLLYNAAYTEILGERHPGALGEPLPRVWPEIWSEIRPLVRRTLAGESLHFADVEFTLHRHGVAERTWFSFSYTPIRGADGAVAGIYGALTETTQRIEAERERADELDRLRQLFDRAPGFMAVTSGPEHLVELVNEACKQLIGREDVTGLPVREAVPELAEQVYLDLFDRVYATGEPFVGKQMEVYFQPPGLPRMLRYVDFVYQPITGPDGRVGGVFVQGIDVTEHREAEAQLRESEAKALEFALESESYARKLDALLDAAPVGILYADAAGRLEIVNPAVRRAWGEIPETARVEDYRRVRGWWADGSARHGQPLQPGDWPLARALGGEDEVRAIVEVEPFDAPGRRRTATLHAKPVRAQDGTIVGAVVAEMDISEQVEAQQRLRESEAKFRTITEAMPQIVWSTRPDGHADYFNQRWYDYTGLPEGSTDGLAWLDACHPDDRARTADTWRHSLATGAPYQIEYRLRHWSGDCRWVLGRALPVRDGDGRIVRWMGTCTDIHEQKQAQEFLQDASRRKDEFLAMLAHELRNPLAPISAAADVLRQAPDDAAQVRAVGEVIQRQAHHLSRMVDDLLDVSRVTRGLAKFESGPVDLAAVIRGAVEQASPLIDERGHVLRLRMPDAGLFVLGDRVRLTQVVANLLNNAAKYTRGGGTIEVIAEATDADAIVHVRDDGSGIEPSLLPYVFDLFTQGERGPDRQQGGLGIGLALARSILALHGGDITARSEGRGHGSCFTIRLPRIRPEAAAGAIAPELADEPAPAARPLRIDVVDDNVDAAHTLALLLELQGHDVRTHADATGTLEAAEREPAEVYILDIGLPDMTGHELARRLRAHEATANAHLIALTGYGRADDRERSREAGFDRHFVKPVDGLELLDALRELSPPRR